MAELDPKSVKIVQEQIEALRDNLLSLPDILNNISNAFGKSNTTVKELNKGYNNIISLSRKIEESTYNINYAYRTQKELRKQIREISTQETLNLIRYQKIKEELSRQDKSELNRLVKDIDKLSLKQKEKAEIEGKGGKLSISRLKTIENLQQRIEQNSENLTSDLSKQAVIYYQQSKANQNLKEQVISVKKANDQVNKSLGITGATLKILNNFPGLSAFSDYFDIDEVEDDLIHFIATSREAGVNIESFAFKTQVLFKGLGKTLVNVFENASDPALIFGTILKSAFTADTQITNLSKALSVVKSDGKDIRQEWVRYSRTADSVFVTTTNMLIAQESLSKELEIAVAFTGKQLDDYIHLNKLIGLSDKATSNITKMGIINRKSTKETTELFLKGAFAQQQINRVSLSNKDILEEIGNLSGGTLIKFKGQEEAIGRAVVKAKALGLTMEQIDSFGESLLNWESSIENELQAELLTGKSLNLERARLAALTGDQLDLMNAITTQVGTLSEYSKMNIIQQKSLAQAFGMSRDEMSKMLIDQEKFNKLGDTSKLNLQEQLDLAREKGVSVESQLYQSLEQQAAADKFNQTVEKLKEILTNIVDGPIGMMLDKISNIGTGLTKILGNAFVLNSILGVIAGRQLALMYQGLIKAGIAQGILTAKTERMTIAQIIKSAWTSLGGMPVVGPALAAGAIGLGIAAWQSYKTKTGDDVVSPGYGNRTLLGPEGSIALNDKDTVIAGTNLFPNQSSSQNISSIDISPLVKVMNEVKIILQETKDVIKNKDTNVYMDSQKVGNQLNLSYNRTQ